MVQVAIKSSLDTFYSEINCMLHCLIDLSQPMSKEEFKKFWEMIPKANESVITIDKLYDAYLTSGSGDVP